MSPITRETSELLILQGYVLYEVTRNDNTAINGLFINRLEYRNDKGEGVFLIVQEKAKKRGKKA